MLVWVFLRRSESIRVLQAALKVNRNYYRNHILPRFKGRPIAGIDSRDVRQWFASLHAKPAAADRSAPILSVIMRQAEIYGYRPEGSNPCTARVRQANDKPCIEERGAGQ